MRDKSEIMAVVRQTLGTALGRPVNDVEDVNQADEPGWDSIKHLEFMLMLEEAFGIVLEPDDFAVMTDVESCVVCVMARLDGETPAG
jgi:acyl carrier protein